MNKPIAELHNFALRFYNGFPELIGNVKHHTARPDLLDGMFIHTSTVLNIDFVKMRAETINTIYELGNPAKI